MLTHKLKISEKLGCTYTFKDYCSNSSVGVCFGRSQFHFLDIKKLLSTFNDF